MRRTGASSTDGWWPQARRVDSPNFGPRPAPAEISLLLIHNISLPPGRFDGDAVERFFTNTLDTTAHPYFEQISGLEVSAHFFIRRSGETLQFVSVLDRAWHAGRSCWQGQENCNDYSVGVELEGTDDLPYAEAQYATLLALLSFLRRYWPLRAVAGHCHVAPGRKTDPGASFSWPRLRQAMPDLLFPDDVVRV